MEERGYAATFSMNGSADPRPLNDEEGLGLDACEELS